jgi:hypothetical protein
MTIYRIDFFVKGYSLKVDWCVVCVGVYVCLWLCCPFFLLDIMIHSSGPSCVFEKKKKTGMASAPIIFAILNAISLG